MPLHVMFRPIRNGRRLVIAEKALVLDAQMNVHVRLQVLVHAERPAAHCAFVCLVARMHAMHMSANVRSGILFAAYLARDLWLVRVHAPLVMLQFEILFAADVALGRLFHVVSLQVLA